MINEKRSGMKYVVTIILLSLAVIALLSSTIIQLDNLHKTKNELAATKTQLTTTQSSLTSTQAQVETAQNDLAQTQTDLANTQNELATTRDNLTQTQNTLDSTSGELTTAQANLRQTQTDLANTKSQLTTADTQLNNLQVEYDKVTAGYSYLFSDPTYSQMESFLAADPTNNHPYDITNYNCYNFTADTIANAAKQHIRCGFVYILFPSSAHAIVAFDTTDKGLIYIDPQNDDQVNLQVGKRYCQCEIAPAGYFIIEPSYDDTVLRFSIIW